MKSYRYLYAAAVLISVLGLPLTSYGQTDEIQVYDAGIADQGKFNLTYHHNFTPKGQKEAAFPGGLVPDKTLVGVPEWAYGVTKWFEAGLYMPIYSVSKDRGAMFEGAKLRALFVAPNADDRAFVYGVNFEFSYNARSWDTRRFTSEIRPIVGWHLKPVDVIVNPIVDTSYYGGIKNLEFVPATRVAYNLQHSWAVALEEYDGFGPLRQFLPAKEQAHQLFWVVDHDSKLVNIEAGIGFGLTSASDRIVLKLILSRDLN